MKTEKITVNIKVPNRHSFRDARLTYTHNAYYLYAMVYTSREGIQQTAKGGARIRNVKTTIHTSFWAGSDKSKAASRNIVLVPVFKSEEVPLELEMPLTVPSGRYYLRVLQISASPSELKPLEDPNTIEAMRMLIDLLKNPRQNLVHELVQEFDFKNSALDKHLDKMEKQIKFFEAVFVDGLKKQPRKVIEQLLFDSSKLRLEEISELWELTCQLYHTIRPDIRMQEQMKELYEAHYPYIANLTVIQKQLKTGLLGINKFIFEGKTINKDIFNQSQERVVHEVWLQYAGHVIKLVQFSKDILSMFKQSLQSASFAAAA